MKKIIILTISTFFLLSLPSEAQRRNNQKTTTFSVNIDCQNCINKIQNELAYVKGVRDLQFDIKAQTVSVRYRSDRTDKAVLKTIITDLGFEVEELKEKEE